MLSGFFASIAKRAVDDEFLPVFREGPATGPAWSGRPLRAKPLALTGREHKNIAGPIRPRPGCVLFRGAGNTLFVVGSDIHPRRFAVLRIVERDLRTNVADNVLNRSRGGLRPPVTPFRIDLPDARKVRLAGSERKCN